MKTLILASASPQRRTLLERLDVPFEVAPCAAPEPDERPAGLPPATWVERLALHKACCVAAERPERWVLGADTLAVCDGEVLGKPRDAGHAREMLTRQAGARSAVLTGVALLRNGAQPRRYVVHAATDVWMRADAALLDEYLASGDWAGKAGAYGIQTVGDRLVARIEGSFSNVVGLPLALVARLLRNVGFAAASVADRD